MTTQIDLPTILLLIDPPNNIVRLTDKTTGSAKAMTIGELEKLLHLGTKLKLSELP